jgi:hypothetical protein
MKTQFLSIVMFSVFMAFIVAACERIDLTIIKLGMGTGRGRTTGAQVPPEAQVSLDKIAVGVVKGGWEMIDVTAINERGEPDKWGVSSNDETIAKVSFAGNQITVRGVNQGETTLVITSASGVERTVPVRTYWPMELDVGDLTISYVDEFEYRWNDRKSKGIHNGSFWHPVVPKGWHALGSLGFKGYYDPNGREWMIIVKESKEGSGALARPLDYVKEYDDRGSGADDNGSFWTPFCPCGYVAMGTVVNKGHNERPSLDEVMCVRKDLTKPGEVGDLVWNDEKTGAEYYLGAWRITIPDVRFHERAYLETGTFVGWGNAGGDRKKQLCDAGFGCWGCEKGECHEKPYDYPVINVLSVDLPILIETPEKTQIPQLTGYEQPPLTTEPAMLKSMLVPFSALLGGKDFERGDIEWLVENSPFVRVDRTFHNQLMFHSINNTSLEQQNHIELVSGVSETDSKTMSHTVGVSITHESGVEFKGVSAKTSLTASYQFGYESTHSITEMQEKHTRVAIRVPSGKAAALWQQRNKFRVMRHNKGELETMAELDFGIDTYIVGEYPD